MKLFKCNSLRELLIEYTDQVSWKGIKLTREQSYVGSCIVESNYSKIVLKGKGGVGKTVVIGYLVDEFNKKNKDVIVLAPTNQACNILQQTLDVKEQKELTTESTISINTIASFLGLQPSRNERGEIDYVVNNFINKVNEEKIVIVDEASMIDTYTIMKIEECLTDKCRIIYVGDDKQLPPLYCKNTTPPIFSRGLQTFYLNTVLRNNGEILNLSEALRSYVPSYNFSPLFKNICTTKSNVNIYFTEEEWKEKLKQQVKINAHSKPYKIISYKNSVINKWNKYIRKLHNYNETSYVPNDYLLARSPIIREACYTNSNNKISKVILPNNSKFYLKEKIQEGTYTDELFNENLNYEIWKVKTELYTELLHLRIISLDNLEKYKYLRELYVAKYKELASNKAVQKEFNKLFTDFENSFDNVNSAYSLTIHRSQGSTFENVFLDATFLNEAHRNILTKPLLYTGISRASETLHILLPTYYN